MTRVFSNVAIAIVLALGTSAPALAETSQADCTAMYEKVDTANAGHITGASAKPYLEAMEKAGKRPADTNKMTEAEFSDACMKDAFKDVAK